MPDFSSSTTPFQLPRLSRNEARARTTVAQCASGMQLHLSNVPWRVDLIPQSATQSPVPDLSEQAGEEPSSCEPVRPRNWLLSFEWSGAPFHLRIPSATAGLLASPLLAGAPLPTLPQELALAVLEAALSDAADAVGSIGRGKPELLALQADASSPANCPHEFLIRLRTDRFNPVQDAADDSGRIGSPSSVISATLHTDSLGLMLLAGVVSKRPPARSILNDQIPLRLPAEIGFTQLPAQLVSTLQTGDVILLDACHVGDDRVLWLTANGSAGMHVQLPSVSTNVSIARAQSEEDAGTDHCPDADAPPESLAAAPTLTVIQAWKSAMPSETTPATEIASMDGVPIRISFDLGDVTLTLAQALALQPGQAITLSRPLNGPVRIRANGAVIGEGDLVQIDDQLGVSIRSLFASGESDAA